MRGTPRRDLLVRFASTGPEPRVDVGADHGRVAARLGCVATERQPGRIARPGARWVVADGLRGFRAVGTAIIAGMGARTIAEILTRAPRIEVAVLHAQDDAPALRTWLASSGWRITDEALARDGKAFAEVLRVEPGIEAASGLELAYGPVLLASDDPALPAHLALLVRDLDSLLRGALPGDVRAGLDARRSFLVAARERALDRVQGPLRSTSD